MRRRGVSKIYLYPLVFMAAVVTFAVVRIVAMRQEPPAPPPATQQAATQPATEPVVERPPEPPLVDLLGLLRTQDDDYPTTQPLDLPADLDDAARIVLDEPVHVDGLNRIWITHPRGKPVADLLRKPLKGALFIVREEVLHLQLPRDGKPVAYVRAGEGVEQITPRGTEAFASGAAWNWRRAMTLGDDLYVPEGAALWRLPGGGFAGATRHELPGADAAPETPVALWHTGDTLLAWCPHDNGKAGSARVMVIKPGEPPEITLTDVWGERVIQLVPLADGNVLAINKTDAGIALSMDALTPPPPLSPETTARVGELVAKLSDPDPRVREQTQRDIEALGPTIYPELAKLRDVQMPEAQVRIESILGQKFAPRLAGLIPLEGLAGTIARFDDGGSVLLLSGGGIYTQDGRDQTQIPAWVSIRPGRYVERLPEGMVAGFVPGRYGLFASGSEWVVFDPVLGARRWIGSQFQPLLPEALASFDELVAVAQGGRWVMKSSREPGKTLIIDPWLPDPTPKLPVWIVFAEQPGWTSAGWPAVKQGERVTVLGESGWRVAAKDETFQTAAPNVLPTSASAPDGRRFDLLGGSIRVTSPDGAITSWPIDVDDASQLFYAANRVFVIAGGSVHRFDPDKPDSDPEAVFTEHLPGSAERVWLDPAGRLIFVGDGKLTVTFPTGRIPRAISTLMLASPQAD